MRCIVQLDIGPLRVEMVSRWLALNVALTLVACTAAAQVDSVRVDANDAPLGEVLNGFAAAHRIDVVYSDRQVSARRVTCMYTGTEVDAALACILAGQDLVARRIRRRQYVLSRVAGSDQGTASSAMRGLLRGIVTDAVSGEVLPDAHIFLSQFAVGTVTNEAGYFALPSLPTESFRLRVSFLGYGVADTVIAANGDLHAISLHPASVEAGEVIVQSERQEAAPVDPGALQVPVNEIQGLPGLPGEADLLQALRWLPSIQKVGAGEGGLIVRGGQPDQNLYLIDGAPIYHAWHAFNLLSVFQTEAFKNINLYQGTFPAEHGGRLSAVLDVELKDGSQEKLRALAAVGFLSGRFVFETPLARNLSAMVSGRRSFIDQILGTVHPVSNGAVRDTMRTGLYLYDLNGKITWRPSARHRLSLSAYGGRDVFDIRLPFDLALRFRTSLDVSSWLRPSSLFFEVDTRWSNRLLSARYQYQYRDRLFVTATGYMSGYSARERFYIRPVATSSVSSQYRVSIQDLGLKVDVDYYLFLTHQMRMGIRLVQRDFFSDLEALILRTQTSSDRSQEESRLNALEFVAYVQDTWQPTRRLKAQPGLRFSMLQRGTGMRLSPRLGLRYALDDVVLRGAFGVNVQYMHRIRDRYSYLYDLVSYRWVPASRSVDPSSSLHASVGAVHSPQPSLNLSLDTYVHVTRGLLLPRDEYQTKDGLEGPGIGLGALLGQYTSGRALAYGLEANVRWERGLHAAWISYAAGRSRSRAPELDEPRFRPTRFDAPQRLRLAVQRETLRWTFGLSGFWRSGYPITIPVARYAVGDPLDEEPTRFLYFPNINNGRLPPYLRFGGLVAYRFAVGQTQIRVQGQLYNLTLRRNVVDRFYDPSGVESVMVQSRRGLPAIPLFEIVATY